MANGPGVSITELDDGRWRVRWRETVEEDGKRRRVQRERVVRDQATAIKLQGSILRTLEEGRAWQTEVAPKPAPDVVATVDEVAAGWLRSRAARGMARRTVLANGFEVATVLGALRELHHIPEDQAVPGALLTRDSVIQVTALLRARGLADGTLYGTIGTMLRMWTWASDDPATYPGLAPPPRDQQSAKPRPPMYDSPEAPTLAEVDAVLRRVANMPRTTNLALPVAVIARWTGLRVSSILLLQPDDVNLRACTVHVSHDKIRSALRTIPIAEGLRDFLVPIVTDARATGRSWLLKRSKHVRNPVAGAPSETLTSAWEAATLAGEVRREVWQPPTRKIARPDHAMRAAFQDHLVRAKVPEEAIDLLVGHTPKGVRPRHYVTAEARMEAMRDAVALLPPIDWRKPKERGSNVVPMPRR